jgi:DNA-binding MarR family transcriptional regulator
MHENQSSPCNCLNLRRASQAITDMYDNRLTLSGLTISQYSLLRYINRLGPVSVSDLAIEIRLDRTTLVRNLKPLEEKGLIHDASKKGARNRQLLLSESGKNTFEYATALWQEAQKEIEQALGKENLQTLTSLLSKIEALEL